MFICKSKELLFEYYETIFPWLDRCESIFGFKNLRGYDLTRICSFSWPRGSYLIGLQKMPSIKP